MGTVPEFLFVQLLKLYFSIIDRLKITVFQITCHAVKRLRRIRSLTYYGLASEGTLFPFSISLLRQIPQLVRQDMWKMRQEMPENGRISGTPQVYLTLREKETRDLCLARLYAMMGMKRLSAILEACAMYSHLQLDQPAPLDGYLPVENARLYYREIGQGQPIILLHGGPDFDHTYLLPDMDRLSDSFRLIYYDQRGRGKSVANVQPEDVSLESEMQDLESVRDYFRLESAVVLGHSFGGLLAMEYAIRHPDRVSHLILMNTAPASYEDWMLLRQDRRKTTAGDLEKMQVLSSTLQYESGDPDTPLKKE